MAVVLVASALATIAVAPGLAATRHHARSRIALSALERGVLDDINAFRVAHHLVPLRLSLQLTDAARQHSQEMAADGYFAHSSFDGSAFWQRIQRYYASQPWPFWSVGENLLWSSPAIDAAGALQLWEHSPEHLRNLLTARWREIGVSAVHVSSARGVYHGLPVTIVTTDFGVRH